MWSPFGSFWSGKYFNFGQKLPIRTAHHTFPESRHPEVTKSPYHVLSHDGSLWTMVFINQVYYKFIPMTNCLFDILNDL